MTTEAAVIAASLEKFPSLLVLCTFTFTFIFDNSVLRFSFPYLM